METPPEKSVQDVQRTRVVQSDYSVFPPVRLTVQFRQNCRSAQILPLTTNVLTQRVTASVKFVGGRLKAYEHVVIAAAGMADRAPDRVTPR